MNAATRTLAALRKRRVTRRGELRRVQALHVILRQGLNWASTVRFPAPCKEYGKRYVTMCSAVSLGFDRRKGGFYEWWRDV